MFEAPKEQYGLDWEIQEAKFPLEVNNAFLHHQYWCHDSDSMNATIKAWKQDMDQTPANSLDCSPLKYNIMYLITATDKICFMWYATDKIGFMAMHKCNS